MRGVVIADKSPLIHWRSLCWHWLSVIENYCQTVDYKDCPFYYLEKCNVHIFASAANQCGYVSLLEIPIKRNDMKSGSLDLYLFKNGLSQLIEAKYTSPEIESINGGFWSDLTNQLAMACKDVSNITKVPNPLINRGNVEESIGIVFVVPRFSIENYTKTLENVKAIINGVRNLNCDVAAWYFSRDIKDLRFWYENANYCKNSPGVLFLAKKC